MRHTEINREQLTKIKVEREWDRTGLYFQINA